MAPSFGTSGLRGLVVELTADLVAGYTRAFAHACPMGTGLFVGRDLRASSPEIAAVVVRAAREMGLRVTDCGALPTPALALAAMGGGAAAVMVTGSHIPDDRNGLKFYTPTGEITKQDEAAILAALPLASPAPAHGPVAADDAAASRYAQRYSVAFGPQALAGMRLGVYQHSSVARDILIDLAQALGATAVPLARAARFIPVDTEAVDAATRAQLSAWAAEHSLDAIWSTDGDADRPMLADQAGRVVAGDILGVLTARALGAQVICTPVSSNSMIEEIPSFSTVQRCKIGSPYVIAAMAAAVQADPAAKVVGFEANGGFLLGYAAQGPAGPLPALMTRDAALPLIAPLVAARRAGQTLVQALAALPARATASDRLQEVPSAATAALLSQLMDPAARAAFLAPLGGPDIGLDLTDGLRMRLSGGRIVHLRPSGNAPELRVYVEDNTHDTAQALLTQAMAATRAHMAQV